MNSEEELYDTFESYMISNGWHKKHILIDNTSEFVETTVPMKCSDGHNSILSVKCPKDSIITMKGIEQCENTSDAYWMLTNIRCSSHVEIPCETLVGIKKLSDASIISILRCNYSLLRSPSLYFDYVRCIYDISKFRPVNNVYRFIKGIHLCEYEYLDFYIPIPYHHKPKIFRLFEYPYNSVMKLFSIDSKNGKYLDIESIDISVEADLWCKNSK